MLSVAWTGFAPRWEWCLVPDLDEQLRSYFDAIADEIVSETDSSWGLGASDERDVVLALDEAKLAVTLDDLIHRGANNGLADPSDEQRGDRSSVDVLWEDVERPTPRERGRWSGVAIAVAAAILVVVGVVIVADGNGGEVRTDPASVPGAIDPLVSSPDAADPVAVPSVTVPPAVAEDVFADVDGTTGGCEIPQGWAQVCDAESFDEGVMYAVTAGGPGLVAVGSEDLAYYERDAFPEQWYGAGAVADAVVWTSPEGLIWSRVLQDEAVFGGDGSQQMFSVTAGGPGLVAVGRDGPAVDGEGHAAVWTSPDGLTWTRVPHDEAVFGGPGEQRMVSVTVGGPGLVAVGFDGAVGSADVDAVVWTSPDGFTWTRVPHDEKVFGGDSRQMMLSVTAGGPGLVVVGTDGHPYDDRDEPDRRIYDSAADAAVWTSPDGLNWTRVPHDGAVFGGPGEQRMISVTVGGPGVVAVGSVSGSFPNPWKPTDAAVWTSPDGLTWSRVPHDATVFGASGDGGDDVEMEQMLSVTAGGPGLVAVGFDSNDQCGWNAAVWTSPDGLTWSRVPDERGCGSYDRMLSVTVGPSGLVAVGEEHGDPDLAAAVWNG
jgi:hypothetical protein